jgi:CRISPR-associated protein Cmr2
MPDGTGPTIYTAVTFAPVQSFIRSSRKLRDLYGSSLLLSHLARALHDDAEARLQPLGGFVISPAAVNSTRGVPNTLLMQGAYGRGDAQAALLSAWRQVLKACRDWLEQLPVKPPDWDPGSWDASQWEAGWGASWKACENHSWELFHGQGPSIEAAEQALGEAKQQRDWEIPNWIGESSTLSSAEAVVRPRMAERQDPRDAYLHSAKLQVQKQDARDLIRALREPRNLGKAFAGENEEIGLTELVKRMVTYRQIANAAFQSLSGAPPGEILPDRFERTSGRALSDQQERPETIVWFMADGDRVGDHLKRLSEGPDEVAARRAFSSTMRQWAAQLYTAVPHHMGRDRATVVYAGGDDILGALHETQPGSRDLRRDDLFRWLQVFPRLWTTNGQERLTASMGLVWADSQVPQREALQHAREAEASAKERGRNRFALRLLYASGNHLEWSCPWHWLAPILAQYRDREGRLQTGGVAANDRPGGAPKWRHLADDLLWLQERHAIGDGIPAHDPTASHRAQAVAHGLLSAYFPGLETAIDAANAAAASSSKEAMPSLEQPEHNRRLDQWLIDLGRVMAGLERWRDCPKDSEAAA